MTDFLVQAFDYWRSGGPLLAPLAVVSFAMWLHFLRAHRRLTESSRLPPGLTAALARLESGDSLDALGLSLSPSPGRLEEGIAEAIRADREGRPADEAFQDWQAGREDSLGRDFGVLAALTAAAPLLGLLGTVLGMIGTFDAVAESSGGTAGKVAFGISQALITTQVGLVAAIPGVFGLARLERLLGRARVAMGQCRTHLLMALEQRNRATAGVA